MDMDSIEDTNGDDEGVVMIVVEDENDSQKHSTVVKTEENEASDKGVSETEGYLNSEEEEENLEVKLEFDSDPEYFPKESDESSNENANEEYLKFTVKKREKFQKYKLRKPEEQQSYVDELRKKYPELAADEDKLVDTLYQIMLKMKPPEPPNGHYKAKGTLFECAVCGAKKETKPAISRHWQFLHGPRYAFCFACGDDFRNPTNLYRHEKRCNAPDAVQVLKARARTVGTRARNRPFIPKDLPVPKKRSRGKGYPCEQCDAVFKYSSQLSKHVRLHTDPLPYHCDACPAAYTNSIALWKHKKAKHVSQPAYSCHICGNTFSFKYRLKVHIETHTNPMRFVCSHCGKHYATKFSLQVHEDRDHLKVPAPFVCHCCPAKYYRTESLKIHMLQIHGMHLITSGSLKNVMSKLPETQVKLIVNAKNPYQNKKTNEVEVVPENSDVIDAPEEETDDVFFKPQIVKVDDEKGLDFLKCSEKLESGSELDQKEPIQINIPPYNDADDNIDIDIKEEINDSTTEQDIPEDLLEYAKNIQEEESDKPKPLIVIKNGQAIFMDKNNINFFKGKIGKSKITKFKKGLQADIESVVQHAKPDSFDINNSTVQETKEKITKTKRAVTKKSCKSTEVQEICRPIVQARKRQKRK